MQNGDIVCFRTTGYEIADVRNPKPAAQAQGYIIGGPSDTHVVLWCERERREAAPVCVSLSNVLAVNGKPYLR